MKKIILLWAIALLGISACQSDPKQDSQQEETAETAADETPPQDPESVSRNQGGSAAAPLNPGNDPIVESLTKNYWVVEHWVNPENDRATYLGNKGRWWNLQPDGTFEMGIWGEKETQGSWRMYKEKGTPVIVLDAENDAYDTEWEVQINQSVTDASWVGTATYTGSRGIMTKLNNLLTMPTKEQYGFE